MENLENFDILEEIGHGGMGKVYKAREHNTKKLIALKVVKENIAQDERVIKRFQKEAQAAVRLKHPNIVQTYGFGSAKGSLFIVMEYIEGITIAEKIAKDGPFSVKEALLLTRQIAEALAYSHNLGIIHRDIKPQNILLSKKSGVKILDFGIAKTMWDFEILDVEEEASGGDMLMTIGQRLGTPIYMPPEQMRNEPIDGRADLYAVGATMYEMLTGKRPFVAPTVKSLLKMKELEPHPGADFLKKYAPPPVANLVLQMLNKERGVRPRTANKLIHEIDEISRELDVLDKLRHRTEEAYDSFQESISTVVGRWWSKFLDFITEPQFIGWSILIVFLVALSPIFWAIFKALTNVLVGQ